MAIVEEDVERVRSTVAIADVVQGYVALRKVGGNWVGLCPFHAERTGSFNVREQTGRYRCFGCGASGDVFTFVQEIEHVDFVTAVEQLASTAGIQLRYTGTRETGERKRRKEMIEVVGAAVAWYHDRLLEHPDARAARDYLRSRDLAGDTARQFRLGWAPDDWDALSRSIDAPSELLRSTGLAFVNKAGRLQDSFRARVMFPIYTESGDPVAFGGRILPGSGDPAKYKNSAETPVYAKSKTLYGLNWAKAEAANTGQVVVCEGYTDVIGFHKAGVRTAVATCGTALTEEHVRMLKRFAPKVVLAFDADAAGQGAAVRFYEWEQRYEVQVGVARFPDGQDPGELSQRNPAALAEAVAGALPFLGFRLQRTMSGRALRSPEERARVAQEAMSVINEHPDLNVRKLYAGQVATHVGLPVNDLVALAERQGSRPVVRAVPARRRMGRSDNAEFVVIALLVQRYYDIAEWLIEALFADDVARRAFIAMGTAGGVLAEALDLADPEARELLERAAVDDVVADPRLEARNLIAAAARRELTRPPTDGDLEALRAQRDVRVRIEELDEESTADAAAEALLGWLHGRFEERE